MDLDKIDRLKKKYGEEKVEKAMRLARGLTYIGDFADIVEGILEDQTSILYK